MFEAKVEVKVEPLRCPWWSIVVCISLMENRREIYAYHKHIWIISLKMTFRLSGSEARVALSLSSSCIVVANADRLCQLSSGVCDLSCPTRRTVDCSRALLESCFLLLQEGIIVFPVLRLHEERADQTITRSGFDVRYGSQQGAKM